MWQAANEDTTGHRKENQHYTELLCHCSTRAKAIDIVLWCSNTRKVMLQRAQEGFLFLLISSHTIKGVSADQEVEWRQTKHYTLAIIQESVQHRKVLHLSTTKHKVSTTSFISSPLKHIPIIRHVCSLLALCEISPRLFESVVMNVLFPQVE